MDTKQAYAPGTWQARLANRDQTLGVYLVGIGIGPNAPTMKIPGWRNIRDTSELPILLTQIVSDVLQQTKRAA